MDGNRVYQDLAAKGGTLTLPLAYPWRVFPTDYDMIPMKLALKPRR